MSVDLFSENYYEKLLTHAKNILLQEFTNKKYVIDEIIGKGIYVWTPIKITSIREDNVLYLSTTIIC